MSPQVTSQGRFLSTPREKPEGTLLLTRHARHPKRADVECAAYLSGDVLHEFRFFGDRIAHEWIDATRQVMEAPVAGFRSVRPVGVRYCYSRIPFTRIAGDIGDCFAEAPGSPAIEVRFSVKNDDLIIDSVDAVDSSDGTPLDWEDRFDERLF